jgi:micrococcal nuclease
MKNKLFVLLLLIIFVFSYDVYAGEKIKVTLDSCVDGDTARFIRDKKEIKVRFLGIDSPEIEKPNQAAEPYGDAAKNYTCNRLRRANKIYLEYDNSSDKVDKYDRVLAYVFVDDKLLEEGILKNGYANVKYINKNYKYYDVLVNAEESAKINKKGIYSDETEEISEEKLLSFIKKYCKKLLSNILREIFK